MNLKDFFTTNPNVAIAFSGGVDSAYLLYAASQYAEHVTAYYVKSAFQPEFEFNDAKKIIDELKVDFRIINVDVLSHEEVISNPSNRCYHCKRVIFETIKAAAIQDGYSVILDGTNASDDYNDRPGMKALQELSVLSPLRECNLTKDDVRRLSKEANLFTHNKPSYACLATRIATGERITADDLKATEAAEDFLFSLGLSDFRVRKIGNTAKIQVKSSQLEMVMLHRTQIISELKKYYSSVTLDLETR
ncbi:MAG: ATP-dependent sacrificial sulfur transferase LarE [Lachnospiraceae bacterium]|nr:ATP-dependent sacrificial sulfur transferase LarE [Lachnospiraceae bacterium]